MAWVEHMTQAGFAVEVRTTEVGTSIKQRVGVPARIVSGHTAEVEGYRVEGHVPADDIARLLAETPAAKGGGAGTAHVIQGAAGRARRYNEGVRTSQPLSTGDGARQSPVRSR